MGIHHHFAGIVSDLFLMEGIPQIHVVKCHQHFALVEY